MTMQILTVRPSRRKQSCIVVQRAQLFIIQRRECAGHARATTLRTKQHFYALLAEIAQNKRTMGRSSLSVRQHLHLQKLFDVFRLFLGRVKERVYIPAMSETNLLAKPQFQ
jgi:hypothetical protein